MDIEDTDSLSVESSCLDVNTATTTVHVKPPSMKSKSSKSQRGLGSKAEGSFDIFRRLRQSLHDVSPTDTRRKLLPSHGFDVHSVKIIPHDSDMGVFRTPDNKREEEEVLYSVAALNSVAGKVEDDTVLARKLEQLEVRYASEKASELSKLEELENKLRRGKEEEMEELFLLEERLRKLDASQKPSTTNSMFALQGFMFLIGCTVSAVAMYFHMKRNHN